MNTRPEFVEIAIDHVGREKERIVFHFARNEDEMMVVTQGVGTFADFT